MKKGVLSLGLAFLATGMLLGCQDSPVAPTVDGSTPLLTHAGNHGRGGGPPGGEDPETCSVEFDLVIDESKRLHSDDRGKYENGVDKVIVGTGTQGDGFRFATPGKGNKKNVARRVKFDFTGTLWEVLADSADLKATDFRFSNQDPGLNLCTMGMGTPISDTVAVNLPFDSPSWDGASGGLKYGGTTYLGEPCGSPQARVTRTSDTTWVMSGTTACIATGGSILDHNVAMPFAFTLTAQ